MTDHLDPDPSADNADLDLPPFTERGGTDGAIRDLGPQVGTVLDSLAEELTA